jgi:hypothetical protein
MYESPDTKNVEHPTQLVSKVHYGCQVSLNRRPFHSLYTFFIYGNNKDHSQLKSRPGHDDGVVEKALLLKTSFCAHCHTHFSGVASIQHHFGFSSNKKQ